MMTAEQFYKEYAWNVGFDGLAITDRIRWAIEKFGTAYAAAQLAEKEREIARLTQELADAHLHCPADGLEARAEAAEQRLQEAQAELDKCRDRWVKRAVSAEDRLRQREAELEHLREQKLIDRPEGSTSFSMSDKKTDQAIQRMYNALMAIGAISRELHPDDYCMMRAHQIANQCLSEMNSKHTRLIANAIGIGRP